MKNLIYTLITGASSGIGEATARLLASKGHNLLLLARRKDRLQQLCEELSTQYSVAALPYAVDLSDLAAIDRLFVELKGFNINCVLNNAGLALGKAALQEYDWEDFNQMIDTNIKAFTRVAQLSIPFLLETQGHMVNISSIAGQEAYEGGSVYCASKAYVKMISKSLRLD
jgi:NADP-dependent 3-hydroxy acid dehydrogenase YdfG